MPYDALASRRAHRFRIPASAKALLLAGGHKPVCAAQHDPPGRRVGSQRFEGCLGALVRGSIAIAAEVGHDLGTVLGIEPSERDGAPEPPRQ